MLTTKLANRLCITAIAAALAACAGNPTRQELSTVTGAVIGGVVGSALTGSTTGAVVGAGAGAYVGHQIGKDLDRSRTGGH